jgi:hypothetical protein
MSHLLVGSDDVVESIGELALQANPVTRESHRKIAVTHRLQAT